MHFYNHAWKQSRGQADFVIVCNVDEHFDHDDPKKCWKRWQAENITVGQCAGFEMVSDFFPTSQERLVEQVKTGIRCETWGKPFIFDPNAIEEIGYQTGRHKCQARGKVKWAYEGRLLHYKYLGSDYLVERTSALRTRTREDRARGYASHYLEPAEMKKSFEAIRRAVDLFPSYRPGLVDNERQ